jgi:hypothetical protein
MEEPASAILAGIIPESPQLSIFLKKVSIRELRNFRNEESKKIQKILHIQLPERIIHIILEKPADWIMGEGPMWMRREG